MCVQKGVEMAIQSTVVTVKVFSAHSCLVYDHDPDSL